MDLQNVEMAQEKINKLDEAFKKDLQMLIRASDQDMRVQFEKVRQEMQDPIKMVEDLHTKRLKKKQKIDELNMNRGCWEPMLPKGISYMPSNWVGDFDFAFAASVPFDEKDNYYRVYREIIMKPDIVYENLRNMIFKNK